MGANTDVVRRLTEEVFVDGNTAAIDEFLADDFTSHDAPPGLVGNRDGFRQLAEMVIAVHDRPALRVRRVHRDRPTDASSRTG